MLCLNDDFPVGEDSAAQEALQQQLAVMRRYLRFLRVGGPGEFPDTARCTAGTAPTPLAATSKPG